MGANSDSVISTRKKITTTMRVNDQDDFRNAMLSFMDAAPG